jgi:hypothetical protein
LQILHRQWPRRRIRYPVDIPWFNDLVDTLNTFLRNYFKEDRVVGVQLSIFFIYYFFLINYVWVTFIMTNSIVEEIQRIFLCSFH